MLYVPTVNAISLRGGRSLKNQTSGNKRQGGGGGEPRWRNRLFTGRGLIQTHRHWKKHGVHTPPQPAGHEKRLLQSSAIMITKGPAINVYLQERDGEPPAGNVCFRTNSFGTVTPRDVNSQPAHLAAPSLKNPRRNANAAPRVVTKPSCPGWAGPPLFRLGGEGQGEEGTRNFRQLTGISLTTLATFFARCLPRKNSPHFLN